MRLGILGPIEIRDHDGALLRPRRRARELLGVLALRAGAAVGTERIVDELWGERPPPSARTNLRGYVAELRRCMPPDWLTHTAGGYRLAVETAELDLLAFGELADEGLRAAEGGRPDLAVERLTRALGLWRGPVLDGVAVPDALRGEVDAVQERRLVVLEACGRARLDLGQHDQLAGELTELVTRHPLRERLWCLLMLAQYRSGRQADAVRGYQRLRALLDAELGVRPDARTEELYLRIMRADPRLAGPAPRPAEPRAGAVPWQLPPDIAVFVGRRRELDALDATGPDTAVLITSVSGTAGVGKTALALRWAHRSRDRFPDGCLYADLRGYGPERPVEPARVLVRFIRALDPAAAGRSRDLAELTARYRTLLAGRRVLVLLDNARTAEQVRPLLPGTPGCGVIVTSRDDLVGLVVRDGARRLELDLLPSADAVDLLSTLVGERVRAEPAAAAALARRCARLPLALRIVADLAHRCPDRPLAELVTELTDRQHGLDLLDTGDDEPTGLRAVFDWSHDSLDAETGELFRLLALHPGRDLDAHAAAALAAITPARARQLLDRLRRAHLLHHIDPGRYGMHDLLRAYAADRAAAEHPDTNHAALTRLFDHYRHAVAAAVAHYTGDRPEPAGIVGSPPADLGAAIRWLDTERANLVAVVGHCAEHGWPTHACQLSDALGGYLRWGSHHRDAFTVHEHALRAACRTGDRVAEGAVRNRLGRTAEHVGQYSAALAQLEQALALRRETGDRRGEAETCSAIGLVHSRLGRNDEADRWFRRCLLISHDLGDIAGEAVALTNLGFLHYQFGRYPEAIAAHHRVLEVARTTGERVMEGFALGNLSMQYARLGKHRRAVAHSRRALAISVEVGDRSGEGIECANLGVFHTALGEHRSAADYLQRALRIHQEVGDRASHAEALLGQAGLLCRLGRYEAALTAGERALALNAEIGDPYQQVQSFNGVARTNLAMGRRTSARRHYDRALAGAARGGYPYERAEALCGLARLRLLDSDVVGADEAGQQAMAIFTRIGVPPVPVEAVAAR